MDDKQMTTIVSVFKALADPVRLRILGAIADHPLTGKDIGERLRLTAPTVSHHMAKLVAADLVRVTPDGQRRFYAFHAGALRELTHSISSPTTEEANDQAAADPGNADDAESRERAKVLRDFFDGARLKQIPAQRKKRVVVLQHLVQRFEPNRTYPERAVNDLLREAHEDVATLRRELVDYGFLTRAAGVYQVAGALPNRSRQVAQEIIGDEHAWLNQLLTAEAKTAR